MLRYKDNDIYSLSLIKVLKKILSMVKTEIITQNASGLNVNRLFLINI